MIIKSMSRKEPTFAQLFDYITRDGHHDSRFTFTQNFFLKGRNEILWEFERNAEFLWKRKNGNYLYHEVISISRAKQISEQRQKELLQDIISQYAKSRGKGCLIFGGLHDEKDNNLHYHLIISANEVGQGRRYRLPKATFEKVKRQTEFYVLERYPELEQEKIITKQGRAIKTSNTEWELKRRTREPSKKDLFKAKLQEVFSNSVDKQSFFDNLKEANIEVYTRGKTIGFTDLDDQRNHRLKTLGLETEFAAINATISQAEKLKKDSCTNREWVTKLPFEDQGWHQNKLVSQEVRRGEPQTSETSDKTKKQPRWTLQETITRTKQRVFRTLHKINNFLNSSRVYVNKRRIF